MGAERRGWLILLVAGLTEVVWAVCMGRSDGFTHLGYTAVTLVFLAVSTYLLSRALDHGLPVGSAYAVWVGIGALGTVTVSALLGMEQLTPGSLMFILLVAVGVMGLQATGRDGRSDAGSERRRQRSRGGRGRWMTLNAGGPVPPFTVRPFQSHPLLIRSPSAHTRKLRTPCRRRHGTLRASSLGNRSLSTSPRGFIYGGHTNG